MRSMRIQNRKEKINSIKNVCKGVNKSGTSCKNKTKDEYCHHHKNKIQIPRIEDKMLKNKKRGKTPPDNKMILKNKKRENNETEGKSFEVALCELNQLPYENEIKADRYNRETVNEMKKFLLEIPNLPKLVKFIGEERINNKINKVDFIDENGKTFSAKSNKNGMKISPQVIGQASRSTFCNYFKQEFLEKNEIKEIIYENIPKMINEYWKNLFCCDYLFWIYRDSKKKFHYKIFEKNEMLNKYLNLESNEFGWTRELDRWNESNTLKWKGMTLGEFQIHNNRNCIKMRFDGKFILQDKYLDHPKINTKNIKKPKRKEDSLVYDPLVL
jgi:hypothetical protein